MPKYEGPVRIADASCEEEAMRLCRELHAENGLFSLNEDKVRAILRKAFDRQGGILGVIGSPNKIEGMVCLQISSFWYTDDPILEELFVFVSKPYRQTKAALHLMRFAKWCGAAGPLPLFIGVVSNDRTAGKVRLYEREFKKIGAFFIDGLPSVQGKFERNDDNDDGAKSNGDVGIL